MEQRPKDRFIIEVFGCVTSLISFQVELEHNNYYGIAFKYANDLGNKVLAINIDNDTIYGTELGINTNTWKRFNYPEQKEELLTELCNESKRRFEASSESTEWKPVYHTKQGYPTYLP